MGREGSKGASGLANKLKRRLCVTGYPGKGGPKGGAREGTSPGSKKPKDQKLKIEKEGDRGALETGDGEKD